MAPGRRAATWQPQRVRDLVVVPMAGDDVLVVACDSCAGVGPRQGDTLAATAFEVGHAAAKVPLMEVLAAGAVPFLLANGLGMPLEGVGAQVVAGIRAACDETGHHVEVTGSDEVTFPTTETSVGTTVIGRARAGDLRIGTARAGDDLVVIGEAMGGDVRGVRAPEAATIATVVRLLDTPGVREVLPVGSRGIAAEATDLADTVDLQAQLVEGRRFSLVHTAGPATAVIAVVAPGHLDDVLEAVAPVQRIGRLVA